MEFFKVSNISKTYIQKNLLKQAHETPALRGVSFRLARGEILGVVGETGCGKSTLARIICALEKPDEGQVFLEGQDLLQLRPRELNARRKDFQIIFQDSVSSMNPRMKVSEIIAEPLRNYNGAGGRDRKDTVIKALELVGLPKEILNRYPHQLSGGQRQRVNIARALVLKPKLLVCDEPTSSLDVSVQAQVLNLLAGLRDDLGLSIIFISHDLGVIRYISDRVIVMRNGRVLEELEAEHLLAAARHPYTKLLIASVPGATS